MIGKHNAIHGSYGYDILENGAVPDLYWVLVFYSKHNFGEFLFFIGSTTAY